MALIWRNALAHPTFCMARRHCRTTCDPSGATACPMKNHCPGRLPSGSGAELLECRAFQTEGKENRLSAVRSLSEE